MWLSLSLNVVLILFVCVCCTRLKHRHKIEVEQLTKIAMFDDLTGLYRRRFFDDRAHALENEMGRQSNTPVFVLFIDLDHFKEVNDTRGHEMGDRVLRGVAVVVLGQIRANDIATRWGGEEIVVLGRGDGIVVAERMRVAIANRPIEGSMVTVSIGAATLGSASKGDTIEAARIRADRALFLAKRAGRNRVVSS